MFVISLSVCPCQAFPAPFRCSTLGQPASLHHKKTSLSVIILNVIDAERRKYAYYAECRYDECRGAFFMTVDHWYLLVARFPAARWQHESQINFATFIYRKITKLLITQQPLELEKKTSAYLKSLQF
jgi:hypothetical protein